MKIIWTVLTDGRKHYIQQALPTWLDNFSTISDRFIIDDSGDPEYRQWLSENFQSFTIVPVSEERSGFAAAMQKLFSLVKETGANYCFHLEDDFLLLKQFDINKLIDILELNKRIAQVSLMRGPWYHNEHEHGGLIEAIKNHTPGAVFIDKNENDLQWTEHSAYWTCNPNLFSSSLTKFEWPSGLWSESRFGRQVFKTYQTAAVYGKKEDWPYIEHIGRERYGSKY